MKHFFALFSVAFILLVCVPSSGAEKTRYPAPRFPSYVKPPKSIDDVMPSARGGAPDRRANPSGVGGEGNGFDRCRA
jgi:hypothetical protein